MPDPIFDHPLLAQVYDAFDDDRSDLVPYVAMATELGAQSVVDIGCGTGALAVLLAARGLEVTGVDPAEASLAVARTKDGAEQVRWLSGRAEELPALGVDLGLMTGNVAQVFVTDHDWRAALAAARDTLRPGGHLVFETRRPERRVWQEWATADPLVVRDVPGAGVVERGFALTSVALPLVSFRFTFRHPLAGALVSESTLRFRSRAEVEADLAAAGFDVLEVRDAPDRPGCEYVFLARRPS